MIRWMAIAGAPLFVLILTAPPGALADEAASDHTATAEEQALVVVYWALLVAIAQNGSLDPVVPSVRTLGQGCCPGGRLSNLRAMAVERFRAHQQKCHC
jgi:hypothetical protein